jgi:hypothetical protein
MKRTHSGKKLKDVLLYLRKQKTSRKKFAEMCGVNTVTISLWYEMEKFSDTVWEKMLPVLQDLDINPDYITGTSDVMTTKALQDPSVDEVLWRKEILKTLKEIRDKLP